MDDIARLKILNLVNEKKNISYEAFEELFDRYNNKIKYEFTDILRKNGIELVESDEINEIEDNLKNKNPNSEMDLDPDFVLDEVKSLTEGSLKISRKKVEEIFEYCIENIEQIIQMLKNVGYQIMEGQEFHHEAILNIREVEAMKKLSNEMLVLEYRNGKKEAYDILVEKNIGLIRLRAYKLFSSYKHELEYEDLVQEGIVGFGKGIEKYNSSSGYRVVTYVVSWIDQNIIRAILNTGRLVRVPVHVQEKLSKINKELKLKIQDMNYENMLPFFDYDDKETNFYFTIYKNYGHHDSYDREIGEDGGLLAEILVDHHWMEIEKNLENKEIRDYILNSLERDRDKKIIVERFGLFGYENKTLEQIAKEVGVTRERIRQIEVKILEKLRNKLEKTYRGIEL